MANETAKKTLKTRIKLKRDTSANWEKANPVLLNGETIIVDTANNETRTKTGDGTKTYTQLPFDDEGTKGGKGLSSNDYTAEDKAEVAKVNNKVDKVTGKGLSANDFTSAYKTKLDNLDTNLTAKANTSAVLTKTNTEEFTPTEDYHPATKKYVDDFIDGAFMMEYEINDSDGGTLLDSGGHPILSRVNATNAVSELDKNKVDKVLGKGLSTNDFTDAYKSKLDNLDSKLNAKAPAYSYGTSDLTAGTSTLTTGKLHFVYE